MYEFKCTSILKIILCIRISSNKLNYSFYKLCVAVECYKEYQRYLYDLYGLRKTVL